MGDDYGPKPVSDGVNKILAIVAICLAGAAAILLILIALAINVGGWSWPRPVIALVVIALGCAIAAIVLVCVKKECNLAIFILSLIAIVFAGIIILWLLLGWLT